MENNELDTIENSEPVGGADVTASQDTSQENDTQPTEESTDANNESEVEEEVEKVKLAGKYETPEELEKAYKELESKQGEFSQKAELINRLEKQTGKSSQEISEFMERQEQERIQQDIQANPGAAAFHKVQALEQQLALQNEEKELDSFLKENPQYSPQRDKILKLGLNIERDKPYADIAKEYFGESIAQGQQDAYKKIDQKQKTQATGVLSTPQKKFSDEDLENMTAAEMEAIIPHADISGRV